MLDGEAAALKVFANVFDLPELLEVIAGYARKHHLADLSALIRTNTTTRRHLAHLLSEAKRSLQLVPWPGELNRVVSNSLMIVDTHFQHVTLRGLVERDRDFWPSLRIVFDDHSDVKILYAHGRCFWKGPDVVRFLDWFTRLYPNRVLACCLDFISPRDWYRADWTLIETHPAVRRTHRGS